MGAIVERFVELVGVLVVSYAANETFGAAVLLAVAALGALVGLVARLQADPHAVYSRLR